MRCTYSGDPIAVRIVRDLLVALGADTPHRKTRHDEQICVFRLSKLEQQHGVTLIPLTPHYPTGGVVSASVLNRLLIFLEDAELVTTQRWRAELHRITKEYDRQLELANEVGGDAPDIYSTECHEHGFRDAS